MPPKGKGKGKGKAGSKGKAEKGSPKKTTPGEPTESGIQTEWMNLCLFCARSFSNSAVVQSHLLTSDHFFEGAPVIQQCRVCSHQMGMAELEHHCCTAQKMVFLDQILSSTTIKKGLPFVCLICRARPLSSKVELIVHLICVHAPNKPKGTCGLCNFTYVEPDDFDLLEESWVDPELDRHIKQEHEFRYAMLIHKNVFYETSLRFPYSCPLCFFAMKSNSQFQAHIISRHATKHRCEEDLFTCLQCNAPRGDGMILNRHINNDHCRRFRLLADKWSRDGLMQRFIDFLHVCTTCWTFFEYDFQFQAHVVMRHTHHDFLVCGWCKTDFRSCSSNLDKTWRNFQYHERKHWRMAHAIALDFKVTEIPLPEEEPDPEAQVPIIEEQGKSSPPKDKGKKGKGNDKGKGKEKGKGKGKK